MAGIGSQVLSHVVRRGLTAGQGDMMGHFSAHHPNGEHAAVNHFALFSAVAVLIATALIHLTLEYTIGSVGVALAMIEADSTTTVLASPALRHDKVSDAALKESLLGDEEIEVEIVDIKTRPITSSIRSIIKHIHSVGGFAARWRGFGQFLLLAVSQALFGEIVGRVLFGGDFVAVKIVSTIIAPVVLCRLHMLWVHAMIAAPTTVPWYRRFVARRDSRVVLLPAFVATLINVSSIAAPIVIVAVMWELRAQSNSAPNPLLIALSIGTGLIAYLLFQFFVVIPVNATLIRVEACLLPQEHETIVNFDRDAILGSMDLTVKGAPGKLFSSAWKSITSAARLRIAKLCIKLFLIELAVILSGVLTSIGILYVTGQLWILALITMPLWEPQF